MPDVEEEGVPQSSAAVARVLAILEYLDGSSRGLNISEIGRRLRIPKSSAHVIIRTLERLGYVRKTVGDRNYSLGLKAYALGHRLIRAMSLSEVALPHMQRLAGKLRLSTHLGVLDKDQGMFIQKVEAPGLIKFDTYAGKRMDLHCTGLGKVILAYESEEAVQHILAKPVYIRYTKNTITSPRALSREIQEVRKLGYAFDDEEEEIGVRCVAVPVSERTGRFLAALSVTGTVAQIPSESIGFIVRNLTITASALCTCPK